MSYPGLPLVRKLHRVCAADSYNLRPDTQPKYLPTYGLQQQQYLSTNFPNAPATSGQPFGFVCSFARASRDSHNSNQRFTSDPAARQPCCAHLFGTGPLEV